MDSLVKIENVEPSKLFTENGLTPILEKIAHEARSVKFDMTTEEGRKDIASLALKVAKSKTLLDGMGKKLTADWIEKTKAVNLERNKLKLFLDNLKTEVRLPLTLWENKEKDRILKHEKEIESHQYRYLQI